MSSAEDAVIKGTLEKRGRTVNIWTKRNALLTSEALTYSHRVLWSNSALPLAEIKEFKEQVEDEGLCFSIKMMDDGEEVTHMFRASSVAQFENWVSQLRALIAQAKGNAAAQRDGIPRKITPADIDKIVVSLKLPEKLDDYDFQVALKTAGFPEYAHYLLGSRIFHLRCREIMIKSASNGESAPENRIIRKLPAHEAARIIAELQQQDPATIKRLTFQAYDSANEGKISQKEFLDMVTRTWYQMFRNLSRQADDSTQQAQIIAFAEAKAGDLHRMAIDTFKTMEKESAGGGQVVKEVFDHWCAGAKMLRAEADGVGTLAAPLTFFKQRHSFSDVAREDHSFQVTVPQGVKPGEELEVTAPSGKKVRIIVPENAQPGLTLTLKLK